MIIRVKIKFILGQNENSVLEYKKLSNSVIEMYHTEVPIQDRNKGFAEKMVKVTFSYIIEYVVANNIMENF